MKKVLLSLLIFTISFLSAQSQTIKGKLLDLIDNKPLAGASLKLTKAKDTTSSVEAVSNAQGLFQFDNVGVDSFFLQVSFISYEKYRQLVATTSTSATVDVGTLFIPKATVQLGGVTVVSKTPPVQQKGDTAQFNASQYKVNPDATTEDLIKKMPGITVDKDGTVTAQGDQVKKITIDGRDFFGDDATAALRNLPSEVVDKIQVFDRLSDQAAFTGFDDGNSVKAINIVTKSGIKNGQFGRIYAGYGTDERYAAGGNVSLFKGDRRISIVGNFNNINQQNFGSQDLLGVTSNGSGARGGFSGGGNRGGGGGGGNRGGGGNFGGGGESFQIGQSPGISSTNAIGLNFSDKWSPKFDVQGSYFYNNTKTLNNSLTNTETIGANRFTTEGNSSVSQNYNHRINLRLEYKFDSLNSLIVTPNLNFQKNESVSHAYLYTIQDGDTANTQLSDNNILRKGYNLRNNILYRHSFAGNRRRSLSIGFNQGLNKNDGQSYIFSQNQIFKGNFVTDSTQNQFTLNPTDGYSLSGNISYTEPLGKNAQLQFSYQPSYSKNNADQETYEYDYTGKQYTVFRPSLSNTFNNVTTTQNGGVTYRLGNSRDNQFSAGVNYQNSKLQSDRIYPVKGSVDQTFSNVLPNLMWRKKFTARSSVNLFYRASTTFPSVTQLQDVVNNTNLLRLSVGNPELKQSYNHFLSARYTFTNTQKSQAFFANFFLNAQENFITNATYIATKDSIIQAGNLLSRNSQLTKPVNLDGYKNFRSFFTFSQPIAFVKSNLNVSTGLSYSKLPSLINYTRSLTDNFTYNAGLGLASNISEYIDFNLSYNINFNSTENNMDKNSNSKYVYKVAGIQLNLLSKKGFFLQNDLTNQAYTGLTAGFNQSYWLWNAAVGKKFLAKKQAELKLSVFDLLKQNQSITRDVSTPGYIIDSQSDVLQQYFLLTFTYSLRNFGKANTNNRGGFQRGGDGRGQGGPPMF